MYSADIDKLAGAHCLARQTMIESGMCTGWLVALPMTGKDPFMVSTAVELGHIVMLQLAAANDTNAAAIILRFVFDTIFNPVYIKTCRYHTLNYSKQQSFFSGYSMNFCSFFLKRIASDRLFFVLLTVMAVSAFAGNAVKVVDGDSLEIGSRRIRLLEIDAPEYRQYCFDAERRKYDCGKEARRYLETMVRQAGYKVDCKALKKDIYKRELSECFAGGKNLNLEMVKAGWAVTYRSEKETYQKAEKKARRLKKGIWQGKFLRPEYYRRLNKR